MSLATKSIPFLTNGFITKCGKRTGLLATKTKNFKYAAADSRCFQNVQHCHYSTKQTPTNPPRSIERAATLIEACQRIVVVCGAGISTPSGLPDFRSPGTGLYDNLKEYGLQQPTDVFDIEFFHQNPYPFFRLAKSLYPGNFEPNAIHVFMKLLSEKNKLRRVYTQNIDALEAEARIPDDEIVFAHGSFHTATCIKCRSQYKGHEIKDDIMAGSLPICKKSYCDGIVKPNIVFFGEDLPLSFYNHHQNDLQDCDLMLILGTSLQVFPVAGMVYQLPRHIPRFLMNMEIVEPFTGDYQTRPTDLVYCGDLITGVTHLVNTLGWMIEFEEMKKKMTK